MNVRDAFPSRVQPELLTISAAPSRLLLRSSLNPRRVHISDFDLDHDGESLGLAAAHRGSLACLLFARVVFFWWLHGGSGHGLPCRVIVRL
eukprot:m.264984 g.264984  ORF g.264984 m.264984 type:complete len:91 (-) comp11057_c0_seq2:2298-2570(-)